MALHRSIPSLVMVSLTFVSYFQGARSYQLLSSFDNDEVQYICSHRVMHAKDASDSTSSGMVTDSLIRDTLFVHFSTFEYVTGSGETLTVRMSSTLLTEVTGFVVQAHTISGVPMDGTWTLHAGQIPVDCGRSDVATVMQDGSVGAQQFPLEFSFRVPSTKSGDIGFSLTLVHNFDVFLENITSENAVLAYVGAPGDPCASKPCMNGGSCLPIGATSFYSCSCPVGYLGTNCESMNPCHAEPCLNGGICVSFGWPLYACSCPDGFSGGNCEIVDDPCQSQPCLNDGSCFSDDSTFLCQCLPQFSGMNCERVRGSPCGSDPCLNGANCSEADSGEAYTCQCSTGYTGDRCERRKTPVSQNIPTVLSNQEDMERTEPESPPAGIIAGAVTVVVLIFLVALLYLAYKWMRSERDHDPSMPAVSNPSFVRDAPLPSPPGEDQSSYSTELYWDVPGDTGSYLDPNQGLPISHTYDREGVSDSIPAPSPPRPGSNSADGPDNAELETYDDVADPMRGPPPLPGKTDSGPVDAPYGYGAPLSADYLPPQAERCSSTSMPAASNPSSDKDAPLPSPPGDNRSPHSTELYCDVPGEVDSKLDPNQGLPISHTYGSRSCDGFPESIHAHEPSQPGSDSANGPENAGHQMYDDVEHPLQGSPPGDAGGDEPVDAPHGYKISISPLSPAYMEVIE